MLRGLILFALECFVEEGDEFLDVQLNEAEVEELNLRLIHFEEIVKFEINLKKCTCFLYVSLAFNNHQFGIPL